MKVKLDVVLKKRPAAVRTTEIPIPGIQWSIFVVMQNPASPSACANTSMQKSASKSVSPSACAAVSFAAHFESDFVLVWYSERLMLTL